MLSRTLIVMPGTNVEMWAAVSTSPIDTATWRVMRPGLPVDGSYRRSWRGGLASASPMDLASSSSSSRWARSALNRPTSAWE